jgi:hypothetical protein
MLLKTPKNSYRKVRKERRVKGFEVPKGMIYELKRQ